MENKDDDDDDDDDDDEDINFKQSPFNRRQNTARSYISLHVSALSNLPIPTIFAFFVEFWLQ
jgi:hypothetical protein